MPRYKSQRTAYKPYDTVSRQQKWSRNKLATDDHIVTPELSDSTESETTPCWQDCSESSEDNLCTTFDNNCTERPALTLQQVLTNWVLTSNVPKLAVTRLLKSLHQFHDNLPKSYKTLLPTPALNYQQMGQGEYVHFYNWISTLKDVLCTYACYQRGNVSYMLIINIDGLPLFVHSPDYKLYPILATVYGIKMRPICIGIYCSNKSLNREMSSPDIFLKDFFVDNDFLNRNLLTSDKNRFYLSNHVAFICDAPARSTLKCIKTHTGYSACERCEIVG
uniref:Transposase domain-containing protein n=1 Tax=Phallusia mammillata TaxID=59560 RepID=A0A6F9DG64_9ASCI|nr:transposase domain-containing protein [Phallusia mammillata]